MYNLRRFALFYGCWSLLSLQNPTWITVFDKCPIPNNMKATFNKIHHTHQKTTAAFRALKEWK